MTLISTTNIVTPPAIEPVTLADAKAHLRIEQDFADDDALISALISVARGLAEVEIKRAFITQTWDVVYSAWPRHPAGPPTNNLKEREFVLPFPELQSVTSINYVDVTGTLVALDPALYTVTLGAPGRIRPASYQWWPYTQPGLMDPITIRIVCGYGDTADAVPAIVTHSIKMLVALLYENRGEAAFDIPDGIKNLLSREGFGSYR